MFYNRIQYLAIFAICICAMGAALFFQHVMGLEPCPLCILQRLAVMSIGLTYLIAALHNPNRVGSIIYNIFGLLFAAAGAFVAGRQVWLQGLPPDQVPACGPGLDYLLEVSPLLEVLKTVLHGSGECAEIQWQFLGLSMPQWTLFMFGTLGLYSLLKMVFVQNIRNK